MPTLARSQSPSLHYTLDDFTDPWEDRPVLVLQHGNGRNGRFWYRWVPLLARHYRILRPDFRGLGGSERPADLERDLTLPALLDDLGDLLDALDTGPVHFCGESMGGIVGLALAATKPERVKTLTLVSTPVFIEDQMKTRYALGHGSRLEAMAAMGIERWVAETTRKTRLPADEEPGLFEWYVREFAKGDPEVQVAMSALVNQADASAFLPEVRVPVLGLYPTAGQITSDAQETLLREGLADFTLHHLPTPWHMVQLLMPQICTAHLLAFLARCEAEPAGETGPASAS